MSSLQVIFADNNSMRTVCWQPKNRNKQIMEIHKPYEPSAPNIKSSFKPANRIWIACCHVGMVEFIACSLNSNNFFISIYLFHLSRG